MQRPGSSTRGDPSDDFRFATLFPFPIRPLVGPLATLVYLVCSKTGYFKLAPAAGNRDDIRLPKTAISIPVLPETVANPVAERRRALAFKAIDERLAELSRQKEMAAAGGAE